ncbi:secretion protein [Novacetimonas pomaceti]|uniref:Secretion protein n=2 Tax=Novacetimonas pomaceti TaxID=2021998 RepID=A0ABX5P6A7_9PROT|nr:secretion protein [Novacetimonas pomaceti]
MIGWKGSEINVRHIRSCSRLICMLAFSLLAGACSVGPHYQPEHAALPAHYREEKDDDVDFRPVELVQWWQQFHDPILNRLVEVAFDHNHDIRGAAQRVLVAHAMRDIEASQWYPQVDFSSLNGDLMKSTSLANAMPHVDDLPRDPHASLLSYGFGASWQIDLFGRIRHQVDASDRVIEQAQENRHAIMLTVLAEVARNYMTLRGTQQRLGIIDRHIVTATRLHDRAVRLQRAGVGNTLHVAQTSSLLRTQQSQRAALHKTIAQSLHALDILVGQLPGSLRAELTSPSPLPKVPPAPRTLPGRLLRHRPDIRRAERMYAQAMDGIGTEVARMYPDLTLPLTYNPNASTFSQLFETGAQAWRMLALTSLPLGHGGQQQARVRSAQAIAEAERLKYHQQILIALREVEDAIVAWNGKKTHVRLLHQAAQDSRLANLRSRRLYEAGISDLLNVLETEQSALRAENTELCAHIDWLYRTVDLHVALGSGWENRT